MHRFLIDRSAIKDDAAVLCGDEAHHLLHVLRLGVGDEIEVLDGVGGKYAANILAVYEDRRVGVRLIEKLPDNEPKTKVTLYQGLPKLDKMDGIIKKCVEIGVHEIVPVLFTRCVAKPDSGEKKIKRYNRIALEAVKQCGRGYIPAVTSPMKLKEAVFRMRADSLVLLPWEEAKCGDMRGILSAARGNERIGIIIGPEGGISNEEVTEIERDHPNVCQITLGPRVLRTETAGFVALALTLGFLGDMGGAAGGDPVRV